MIDDARSSRRQIKSAILLPSCEHKDQLETRGVTNVNQLHRIEFPAWFHTKAIELCFRSKEGHLERATEELWAMKLGLKLLQERETTGSFWWPYMSNLPESEYFDVNPSRYSNDDYKLIVDGIEDIAARRYRQYKSDVNAYIRDKGTAVPYRGLTTEVWEKCIERSSSQKFKQDRQTQEWPSVIETFKVNHQRNGEWVNERAASDYVRTS
ncbi:Rubisco LS methyltransferase [Forsythia ovata]|uniref:Rubisco LS methyltransferase n=1 Tax=Forsythia ovata TaxID=205694 RepID=A0ABD1U5Z1_9LAMI